MANTRGCFQRCFGSTGRGAVVTRASGIRTNGENVVNIKTDWKKRYKISNSAAIPVYNSNAQDYLQNLDLPLGAQLVAVDTSTGSWQMRVPKMEFMDVFIKCVVAAGRYAHFGDMDCGRADL